MSATTKISAKGQVVIPKDVRNQLGLMPGQTLDVIQTGGGVLLRPSFAKSGESFEEITARIKARNSYRGPAVPVDEMDASIRQMWESGGPRWDQ